MKRLLTKWFKFLFVIFVVGVALGLSLAMPQKSHALLPGYDMVVSVQKSTYDPVTKKLKIVVENKGDLDGDLLVWYRPYYAAGEKVPVAMPVANLAVGKSTTKEITVTPPPNYSQLVLYASLSKNLGIDYDEDAKQFTFPLPDLVFHTLRYESGKGLLVEIKNNGTVDARIPANTVNIAIAYLDKGQVNNSNYPVSSSHNFPLNARTIKPGDIATLPHIQSTIPIDAVQIRGILSPGAFAEQDKPGTYGNNTKRTDLLLRPKLLIGPETKLDEATGDINVVIKNDGGRDAFIPGSADVKFTKKYTYAEKESTTATQNVPANTIPAHGSITVPMGFSRSADLISVEVGLVTSNSFVESDKNHGSKVVEMGLPDLSVIDGGLDAQGYMYAKVKSFNAEASIFRSNSQQVSVAFYDLYANGDFKYIAAQVIPVSRIEKNGEVVVNTVLKPGGYAPKVAMIVNDVGYKIPESGHNNPGNNKFEFDVKMADFSVKAILTDNVFWEGIVTVTNEGEKASSVEGIPGEMTWYNDDGTKRTDTFVMKGKLEPKGTAVFTTMQLQNPEKVAKLEAKITNNLYIEKDYGATETNNKVEVLTKRKPDLIIRSLDREGNRLSMTIANIGMGKIDGNLTYDYYWEDKEVHNKESGRLILDPEGEVTRDLAIQIPKLTGELVVVLKTPVEELYTTNNASLITVVGSQPLESFIDDELGSLSGRLAAGLSASGSGELDPEKIAGLLPDSPFYFVEEIVNAVDVGFTFDDEKKADKLKDIADEKIIETAVLIDKGNTNKAIDSLNGYGDTIGQLTKLSDPANTDDTTAGLLVTELIDDALIQMPVLDKLESLPKGVDDSLSVKVKRDEILDMLGDAVDKVKDQNTIADKIAKGDKVKKGMFLPLKDLVAINEISSHIASGKVRDVLLDAKEKHQKHLKNNLQSLDDKQLALFGDYVSKSTGDKVNALKALDDVKVSITDSKVKSVLAGAKKEVAQDLIKDMKSAKGKKLKAGTEYLSDLEGGTITDLRVLSDLASKDNEIAKDIANTKKTSIANFEKHTNSLKKNEKEAFLKGITEDRLDLTQQAVANDVKHALPNSKLGDELDATLKVGVKTKVAKTKGNKKQYDEFLAGVAGETADDKDAINAFTAGFDTAFYKDLMRQQLVFMKSFYADADPELKKILDENYFNDPQIKAFYTDFDSAYEKMFSDFDAADYASEDIETFDQSEIQQEEEPYDASDDTNTTSGCAMIDDPVCGTDGLNYANECEAHDNSTEVAYKGECSEESSIDESGDTGGEESGEVQGAHTQRSWFDWWPF